VTGLATLLAAATAGADTVIAAREVLSCSVESTSADSVRLALKRRQHRTLSAWDVYEIRVSDSSRIAGLTTHLPQTKVVLDSGQSVPSPEVRIIEAMRLRLDRAREAPEQDILWPADAVDTLTLGSSPAKMTTRCLEMNALLRHCGRSDDTIEYMIREVNREAAELGALGSSKATCVSVMCGGLIGGAGGSVIGWSQGPSVGGEPGTSEGGLQFACNTYESALYGLAGCGVGLVAGSLVGLAIDHGLRESRIEGHRDRVNNLVRRVNRAITQQP